MKKLLKSLLVISMVVLISGCGDKKEEVQNQGETPKQEATEKTYKCSLTSNDVVNGYKLESLYEIYAKDDVVKEVVTEEKVTSEDNAILDTFETTLNDTYKATDETYGGYDYEIVRSGDELVSTTTIDYSAMDLKKYVEDNSVLKSYVNDNNELTVEGIKKLYTSLGATCD